MYDIAESISANASKVISFCALDRLISSKAAYAIKIRVDIKHAQMLEVREKTAGITPISKVVLFSAVHSVPFDPGQPSPDSYASIDTVDHKIIGASLSEFA